MKKDVFGFVKPTVDVHTMGLFTMANLLKDCGYTVYIADDSINSAVEKIHKLNNYGILKHWILNNGINRLGFSYRLDPKDGSDYFLSLYEHLNADKMFIRDGGPIKEMSFAGLPETCQIIEGKTNGKVITFKGDDTPINSLKKYGIPEHLLPKSLRNDNPYDKMRWDFAKKVISNEQYKKEHIPDHYGYKICGTENDNYLARLKYAKEKHSLPIIRTHMGPYHPNRLEALKEFKSWCKDLAGSRFLDVLSIGSSQLTQSHFGESWEGLHNGGGVPINSEIEYKEVKEVAQPMLVRTYSGTKNVPQLAQIHERALNISWHALSFWWFNEIDGRGNNSLLDNLIEHFETVKYIATTKKPVEPNVPHHFAFRGADDITFIISGFLAAKACKKMGIQHLILQDMLNTPKHTWGIQDLAKGRAMLQLVRELEDKNFKVSLQLRAGLDYFVPDLEEAKVQLAAVTCMMDDIEPENIDSPEIIHVVNYCEAVQLATPPIIKESIKIVLNTLKEYRQARLWGKIPNMKYDKETNERTTDLYLEAKTAILWLERHFPNLYSPQGFFILFKEGFLPVPYLMDYKQQYPKATKWSTAFKNGGIRVVDQKGQIIDTVKRFEMIFFNMEE